MAALSYSESAYLLRRVGLGGTPDALVGLGREGAVDSLLNYETIDNSAMEEAIAQINVDHPDGIFIVEGRPESLFSMEMCRWWLARMILTRRPFEEKITLFWHHHFATSLERVFHQLMMQQNRTLRQYALARFDTLLVKVAKDPAMLVWLDGETNQKDNPNENFARELQELFTMGTHDALLKEFSEAVRAFYDDMTEHGLADDVVIFQWSEFGRRPQENRSLGTDHGSASSVFVIGNPVKGGLYGEQPSLAASNLDEAGNPGFTVDFRSVYATILDDWLEADSLEILGERFENIGFLR